MASSKILTIATVASTFDHMVDGLSSHTIRAYRSDIAAFAEWAKCDTPAEALYDMVSRGRVEARLLVEKFQRHRSKKLARATTRRRIATLQSFVSQLFLEGYIDWKLQVKPTSNLTKETKKATSQRSMDGPTPEELKHVRDVLHQDRSLAGLRDAAIIALLENPMLREHEVAALTPGDVNLASRTVTIIGKARDEPETLPMPSKTCSEIAAWIEASGVRPGTPLFRQIIRLRRKKMNPHWREIGGQWLTKEGLSTTAIYQMTLARGRRAGLKKKLRPHGLRHTGITVLANYCAEHGIPLTEAMAITRHRKIETLMKYIDRQGERARDILESTSKATR